jgi:glycine hydroxymethyltransferase
MALIAPGDTVLGMSLAAGGHLTHGAPPNFSGKWFKAVGYGVRHDDPRIDFEQLRDLAKEHRPRLIIAGGSAYPPIIDFAAFRAIADEVGAWLMVDMAHFAGLGMLVLNRLPQPYHPVFNVPNFAMATRDRFFLAVEANDPKFEHEAVVKLLQSLDALEVNDVEV